MVTFLTAFWQVMLELAPWLLLGLAVAGLMEVLIPAGWLKRQFSGRGGITKAVLFGIPLPLCSCAVIPVGLGLKQQGAGNGPAVGFLISTPQTGVDSIFVTASLLGWPFALFKMGTALVTGLVGGTVQHWIDSRATNKTKGKANNELAVEADQLPEMPSTFQPLQVVQPVPKATAPLPSGTLAKIGHGTRYAEKMLLSIYRWLMIGVLISVGITMTIDEGQLGLFTQYGPLASMVVALLISLPCYLCATESVPIAAALAGAGFPLGAIMVFLMAGPATNVATIGALWRGLGAVPTTIYLATIIVGSFAGGLLFEAWNPVSTLKTGYLAHHCSVENPSWLAIVSAVAMLAWVLRLIYLDAMNYVRGRLAK